MEQSATTALAEANDRVAFFDEVLARNSEGGLEVVLNSLFRAQEAAEREFQSHLRGQKTGLLVSVTRPTSRSWPS